MTKPTLQKINSTEPNFQLLIGLGNPDSKYLRTYHNVGFIFLDYLKKYLSLDTQKFQKTKNFEYLKIGNLILAKPLLYMNESGQAVKEIITNFKVPRREVLIIQDDSDILLGQFKISFSRNSAGHRGVISIINYLKTKNFWRLRIGIRPKTSQELQTRLKSKDFVLKNISPTNYSLLESTFEEVIKKLIKKEKP